MFLNEIHVYVGTYFNFQYNVKKIYIYIKVSKYMYIKIYIFKLMYISINIYSRQKTIYYLSLLYYVFAHAYMLKGYIAYCIWIKLSSSIYQLLKFYNHKNNLLETFHWFNFLNKTFQTYFQLQRLLFFHCEKRNIENQRKTDRFKNSHRSGKTNKQLNTF